MTTTTTRRPVGWPADLLIFASVIALAWSASELIARIAPSFSPDTPAIRFQFQDPEYTAIPAHGLPDFTGYFTEAEFSTSAISFWPRFLMTAGGVIWVVVQAILALCILRFAIAARRGDVFTTELPALFTAAAIALGVGGILGNILEMAGKASAASEITRLAPESPLGLATANGDLIWPILGGAVLGVLAAVFRAGLRFKRDTEGLV